MRETWYGILLKYIFLILLVLIVGNWAIAHISFNSTDVTDMVNMDKGQIEEILQISMMENSDMAKRITQYSKGKLTVDGEKGIGVAYIDGVRAGLHIDNKKYSMYNIHIGDTQQTAEDEMTYVYDNSFTVLKDLYQSNITVVFYVNQRQNDCLVVVYNNYSNKIMAVTYFNNADKATERLG